MWDLKNHSKVGKKFQSQLYLPIKGELTHTIELWARVRHERERERDGGLGGPWRRDMGTKVMSVVLKLCV